MNLLSILPSLVVLAGVLIAFMALEGGQTATTYCFQENYTTTLTGPSLAFMNETLLRSIEDDAEYQLGWVNHQLMNITYKGQRPACIYYFSKDIKALIGQFMLGALAGFLALSAIRKGDRALFEKVMG